MKRVVCLLLCAVLLMGLLPAAALADGEQPMYFQVCSEDGSVSEEQSGRGSQLHMGYGVTVYFRVYTARTGGEAITGEQLHLYENNEDVTDGMLTWMDDYYAWDTRWVKTANPVFLASVGDQDYEGITQVHEAEVGWFSSRNKSISTALTYGGVSDASVYYDGTEDVTVYLTADFSFTTNITLSDVKKTNNDIQLELESRGSFGERNLGSLLKVTCPANLTGELTVTVPVDLCYYSEDGEEEWRNTYTVTFSKTGKKPDGDMPSRPGEPTAIKVKIDGEEKVCWFGVGEYANDKYDILSGSSMGSPSTNTNFAILAVGLWWKDEHKNGSWDLTMLSEKEAKQVMKQAEFHLEFHAQSGQEFPPEGLTPSQIEEKYGYEDLVKEVTSADALGMPASACYPLEAQHEGTWRVEAVCEMNKKTYTAYGNLERRVLNNVELTGCSTVEEINNALKQEIKKLQDTSSDKRRETNICVIMNELDYTGQIVVPKISRGLMDVGVNVEFIGNYWRDDIGTRMVDLHGGICSDNVPIAVQRINFIGAGLQEPAEDGTITYWEKWPDGRGNDGAENSALYGNSAATAAGCSFTGYYYAMKLTKEMRLCGENNTYFENHIAWYLGEGNDNGGNPHANNCVFERNDIAIQIENFNLRPSFYAPSNCRFIDNKLDIQNNSNKGNTNRIWFIPGNYFVHGKNADGTPHLKTMISPTTTVSCCPMRLGNQLFFDFEWGATNPRTYVLSNDLTGIYPMPVDDLDGKTFEVVGSGEETDYTLATFTFDSADSPAQRRAPAARRSIARFSAEEEKSFDATVRVDRTDEQIDFTMNDPCRSVTVKLPCEFKYGTVTHTLNGKSEQLETVRFDGETVSFETSEGGDYTIEYRPSGGFIVAGYDDQERLVGVQFVSSKDDPVTITASTIKYFKYFAIDRSYRPLDEVVIPRR